MKRLVLCLLFACGSSSSNTSPPASPPPPPPADPSAGSGSASTPPASGASTLGEPCGEGDMCGEGASCVRYYGIAGPRGPEFKSCEIKCKGGEGEGECPAGHRCVTVADGPGPVCRPAE